MSQVNGPEKALTEFNRVFGPRAGAWPRVYQAPGRINLIGEHTDYNGGHVFPATIDLHTRVAIAPRNDRVLQVHDGHGSQLYTLDLDSLGQGEKGQPAEYFKAVAWVLQERGLQLPGCDAAITGNIPLGGGLSSSASLELALALALLDTGGFELDRSELALLCQRAEVEFVGARCGIMDQFTVALGERNRAMLLDCWTQAYELIDVPPGLKILIIHSGVRHRVSTGSYNSRRQECDEALGVLQEAVAGLKYLAGLTADQLDQHGGLLGSVALKRVRHVVTENRRVLDAGKALRAGEFERLGVLIDESHASLRDDFEVSCAELDRLVEIAQACEGVLGSRMMGAGFGGCTISLVDEAEAERIARQIGEQYAAEYGQVPWMHIAGPADAVQRIR